MFGSGCTNDNIDKQSLIMADTEPQHQRNPTKRRGRSLVVAAVGLGLIGLLFLTLGNWQLERAKERRAIADAIEAGRQAPPVRLSADSDTDTLAPWQSAQVSGRWLAQWSILIENRSFEGRPGFWVATPLLMSDDSALLVLRGWVARPIGQLHPFPTLAQSTGTVTLTGEIAERVPRLYELGQEADLLATPATLSLDAQGDNSLLDLNFLPMRQNLSTQEMSNLTGLQFLPVVLLQTSTTDGSQLERGWPTPSVDANTNVGYAIQWFSFAAIAFGALGVLIWRSRRRETMSPVSKP